MTDIEEIDEDELLYCRVGVLRRDAVGVAGVAGVAKMIEGLKLERSTLPLSNLSLVFVAPKFRGTASRYDRPMTSAEVNAIFEVLVLVVNLQVPTCYEVHYVIYVPIYVRT